MQRNWTLSPGFHYGGSVLYSCNNKLSQTRTFRVTGYFPVTVFRSSKFKISPPGLKGRGWQAVLLEASRGDLLLLTRAPDGCQQCWVCSHITPETPLRRMLVPALRTQPEHQASSPSPICKVSFATRGDTCQLQEAASIQPLNPDIRNHV